MSKEYGTGRLHTKSVIDWKKAVIRQLERQTRIKEQHLEQEKTNNQTSHTEPPTTR